MHGTAISTGHLRKCIHTHVQSYACIQILLGQCRLAWGVIRGLHAYIAVASDMRLAYTCRGMLAAHQQSPSVALLVSPLVQRGRLSSATSIDGDGVLCPGRGGIGTSPCEGRVTRLSMKNRSFAEVYLDGYVHRNGARIPCTRRTHRECEDEGSSERHTERGNTAQ